MHTTGSSSTLGRQDPPRTLNHPHTGLNDVWGSLPARTPEASSNPQPYTFNDRHFRSSPSNHERSSTYLGVDESNPNCNPLRESSNSKERKRRSQSNERQHYVERYDQLYQHNHAESAHVMPSAMPTHLGLTSVPLRNSRERIAVQQYASENPQIIRKPARAIEYNSVPGTLQPTEYVSQGFGQIYEMEENNRQPNYNSHAPSATLQQPTFKCIESSSEEQNEDLNPSSFRTHVQKPSQVSFNKGSFAGQTEPDRRMRNVTTKLGRPSSAILFQEQTRTLRPCQSNLSNPGSIRNGSNQRIKFLKRQSTSASKSPALRSSRSPNMLKNDIYASDEEHRRKRLRNHKNTKSNGSLGRSLRSQSKKSFKSPNSKSHSRSRSRSRSTKPTRLMKTGSCSAIERSIISLSVPTSKSKNNGSKASLKV